MSTDKPPSALSIPQPATNNSNTSSPRVLGTSILNSSNPAGPTTTATNGSSVTKVKTPSASNTPTPQAVSHVLPNPSPQQQQQQQQQHQQQQHTSQSYATHVSGPTASGSIQATQYPYQQDSGFMNNNSNPPPYGFDLTHQHLSQGQQPTPQTATSGNNMSNFPPQPPVLQPNYQQHHHGFPQFSFPPHTHNGVSSPGGQPGVSGPMSMHATQQLLPLPQSAQLTPSPSPLTAVSAGGPQASASATTVSGSFGNQPFDTTGQHAPPGMKPRVTATLWEDEGSLCFQVEAKGVCVARREDNHMINGTKLLNVAGMTRGRRDGILKSEKVRHVVKIGPMHLKGVWIPFERALDFANKEKITELLYPLFVHNIGALLYHPTNTHRTTAVMAAAERRLQDQALQSQRVRGNRSEMIPSPQPPALHHHHGMHNPLHNHLPPHPNLAPHPQASNHQLGRPQIERSLSFPTPPSSASSVLGVGNSDAQPFWNSGMGAQPLAIDTVINSATRSMPTTPATTPPGGPMQQMPTYQQQPPPSSTIYSPNQGISQQTIAQQNMQRFGQAAQQQYMPQGRETSNMGPPPTSRGTATSLSRPSSRQNTTDDGKEDGVREQNGLVGEADDHDDHEDHPEEEVDHEADHEQEEEYTHDPSYANGAQRNNYYPPLNNEHQHLSPEMTGSPNHGGQGPATPARSAFSTPNVTTVPRTVDGGSGATPRTTTTPQQQWGVHNQSGYSTPPRTAGGNGSVRQPPARNIYQLVSGDASAEHNGTNGSGTTDTGYNGQQGLGVSLPSQAPPQSFAQMNGSSTPGSNKRIRDIEDDVEHGSRPSSRGNDERSGGDSEGGMNGLKRRKTIREGSTPSIPGVNSTSFDRNPDGRLNRTRSAVPMPRGRR
ncbi:hypothetical protein RUND412_006615 [Rhizina undulata]